VKLNAIRTTDEIKGTVVQTCYAYTTTWFP